ncbi:hypothetical protein ACS0TY_033599 [Phlomoides rotata]
MATCWSSMIPISTLPFPISISSSSTFTPHGVATAIVSCLREAAPILAGLKQSIVVAKVDVDKYKKLTSKHGINGYPTLKIFIHGVPIDYHRPRKSDLLVRFLTKFVAPNVTVLTSDSAIRGFIEAVGSDFPMFICFGLNESMILDLAIKYKKKTWFSVAKDFSHEIMAVYKFDKVIGSESTNETDMGSHMSRFLEGYRGGNVIKKRIIGPTLMSFIKSQLGVIIIFVIISVVLVVVLVVSMTNEESPSVGSREHVVEG